jgi:hypothetical protein
MDVKATIDDIQRRKLDLRDSENLLDNSPHRPEVRIWADQDEEDHPYVSVAIGALFGQPLRFLELAPDEARSLARLLNQVADDINAI